MQIDSIVLEEFSRHDCLMGMTVQEVSMVLGWIGAAGSMGAYYLVSSGRFAADSLRYHALNMFACILLVIACCATGSWPSMVTNLLFIIIGMRMTWKVRDRLYARLRALVVFPRTRRVRSATSLHMQAVK